MLTMDEAAADVDRGAQEPLNTERIEANRGADGVDNRIDRPHLMEFDILRGNVVDLSLGNRELGKNLPRDPLRVGIEVTVTDHRQNLRRFPVTIVVLLDCTATYLTLFTIYGAVLQFSGAGTFFLDWSMAAMGRSTSGAGPGR